MIKKLIKVLLIILLLIVLIIIYLSFIGIKTERFNQKINSRVLEINKKINLDLKNVNYLLNPFNFTINITTKDPKIILDGNQILIKDIRTKISLKSMIIGKFSINDLEIRTKAIRLNDLILLGRSLKNSTELFLLDRFTKSGSLTAKILLKFDTTGKIKDDYEINGFVEDAEFNFLNKYNAKDLSFNFEISKKKYLLKKIGVKFNGIQLSSPFIKVDERSNLFFVNGKVETNEKNFDVKQLNFLFNQSLKNLNAEKIDFDTVNTFTFNINKKLKLNKLNVESEINLKSLIIKDDSIQIKSYLPSYNEKIIFRNHKININFNKDRLNIIGKGKISVSDEFDSINYQILNKKNLFKFDVKTNLKKNLLTVDFLDYVKKEDADSLISIKGSLINDKLKLDTISIEEKNNKILFKNLFLDKGYKIISIDKFDLNYVNSKNIQTKLNLKRNKSNYIIQGKAFDASKIINSIMDNDEENSSIFKNLETKINIKISKTHIDETNFLNDLSGTINFKNNQINNLDLKSTFSNDKKINLSIETNNKKEKITKLFTDFPKPLIKRYDFIKGFEEGYLNYYSLKKNNISNSVLVIDNFKIKEVPVFAKLLSLASLQGIADLLTGEGIRFTDFEMIYSNNKELTTIEEMYAIGPAVSILMEGYIESKKLVSLRGTLVPATTINRSIASIPLLGNILVGKKTGEGVFGVSFKIKGAPKNLKTSVNPIKTLTPRFITRTLEKIKKN
jgi:hypothetical protein